MKIVAKGDLDFLNDITSLGPNELYLRDDNCLDKAAPSADQICSVHQPNSVLVNGERVRFNISDDGAVGEASGKLLKRTADFVANNGLKTLVVHGARYNRETTDFDSAMKLFVDRIDNAYREDVTLTVENDALWFNQYHREHSLFNSLDHIETFYSFPQMEKCFLTLDIEHFYSTCLFTLFLSENKDVESLHFRDFEKIYLQFVEKNEDRFLTELRNTLDTYFKKYSSKINLVHLVGTNYKNYVHEHEGKLPLMGEHLPVTMDQNDFMDYEYLFSKLLEFNFEHYIVLEVGFRPSEYQIVESIIESKRKLTELLSQLKSQIVLN
jgi:sugar phosphate isomerase/epimerase